MGAVIHTDSKSIHEFASEPTGDSAQNERDHLDEEDTGARCGVNTGASRPPHEREQRDDDHVAAAVQQANPFRSSARRYG